ncbi:DUF4369 domain-containing protein [Aquimarina agarilytica]|uniref:DUF4369 domain-containing protein n=1 Tax=Aquimarina agarilytica TaxID=1087449 RepID=UPI000287C894|nr:DUF4369 domain-containing protein [Aquimarina agarilytica]
MRIIYLVLISILLFSCKKDTKNPQGAIDHQKSTTLKTDQYKIEGAFKKFKDSTMVGLFINNDIVDSTYIINGKFQFEGDFTEITDARILVKKTDFFADFWIENGIITLKNESRNRLNTEILGGKVQTEENSLTEKIVAVSKKRDSIYKILSNPNTDLKIKNASNAYLKVIQEEEKQVCFSFLDTHPNSVVSMRLLNIFKGVWEKDIIRF